MGSLAHLSNGRYRSTDVTQLIDEPCPCGLFAKRIAKLKGRVDEMIVCGMGNISPWVFAELLRDVELVTDEWQVRVWHENKIDVIELRVETAYGDQLHIREAVIKHINQNLRDRFADFQKNLEMKLYDFRVIAVERGTLRTARKLKRLVALNEPPIDSVIESVALQNSFSMSKTG